ncbi:MAG: C40 family peptidase [Bacteroidetes bacterium]|nr:C40 family peptidase [Bacteroidota bacterium]
MAQAVYLTKEHPALCSVSVAPVRREASHRAEQTSQLLFGERVWELERNEKSGWVRIRCFWDGYEGWCKAGQIHQVERRKFRKPVSLSSTQTGVIRLDAGEIWLPAGAELRGGKGKIFETEFGSGIFKGKKLRLGKIMQEADTFIAAARSYLHAPYQWGGRTRAGIDCSGLVQMAFKLCGVPCPRDAWQQAETGEGVHFLSESQPGDLAFFDNAEGQIVHVGILCGNNEIIHATDQSGRVVVDKIDGAGIISVLLKRRTHQLRTIRRFSF